MLQNFEGHDRWHCSHITFLGTKWAELRQAKYGILLLPGTFLDKVTPDNDFADEAVVPCDVPVVKYFYLILDRK